MDKILVSTLPADKVDQVTPMIEKSQQKPYRFLQDDLPGVLDSLWLGEIADLSRGGQGEVLAASQEDKIVGMAVCSELPWDSKVIGNKMGSIRYLVAAPGADEERKSLAPLLDSVVGWARSRGIEFLLCKAYADDTATIHALERKGFLLVDTLLDYVYDLRRNPLHKVPPMPAPARCMLRLAGADDIEQLVTVARESFQQHFGRFHSDERISRRQAVRVYEEWMRSSSQGYADWILVAEIDGRIAGYSVWKRPSSSEQALGIRLGHYSIGAVHPDYHGLGLFSALTHAGMELFAGIADYIEGPTHVSNYPVQRAYTKLLWQICDARHSFHKWLKGGG